MESDIPMNESAEDLNEQSERVDEPLQHYNGKPYKRLRQDDLVGEYFETLDAAEKFFYDYAHAIGFSVRKDILRYGKDLVVKIRQWYCSCEGFRAVDDAICRVRTPQKETRCGCKVVFLVNYCSKTKKYVVKNFVPDHNHDLVPPAYSNFMGSMRNCRDSDAAQVTVLQSVSIRTCQAYEYMVDKAGGYTNVGFNIKDLYNKLDASRREVTLDGDSEAALAYLNGICVEDTKFYAKFNVDEENKLCNLFWRDTRSLVDYESFGDVLLFDSTYKTNYYEKPLVLFVGSSNHLTSVVFGCALLLDETIETYVWALETFISSMNGKKPIAVLTDGDEAMQRAVEIVLPGCPHRFCSWHIGKNVTANVRDRKLRERFIEIMWESATPEEFEESWADMIKEFSPKNMRWFNKMYEKRHKWVEAFCKGKFFARMRSTQRCEGMNKYMKDFVKSRVKLNVLVPATVRGQQRLRFKYSETDYKCRFSKHKLTTQLRKLEEDASKIYTDNVLFVVRKEIERVGGLIIESVVQSDGFKTYVMLRHNKVDRRFNVVYFQGESDTPFVCSCQKMEYEGIPCCHIFNVLMNERITKIPTSLVMKRWTISEKCTTEILDTCGLTTNVVEDGEWKLRFGYISDRLSKLSFRASSSKEIYEMVSAEVDKLEKKLEAVSIILEVRRQDDGCGRHENLIRDPDVVKTKGKRKEPRWVTGKKGRKCSKCGGYGHNKQSCEKNQSSGPCVETTSMSSGSSSEDEIDGEDRGEGNIPQANGAVPSSAIPYYHQVQQLPFPQVYQQGGYPVMQNLLNSMCFKGTHPQDVLYGVGHPHMYGPNLFNPRSTLDS